MNKLSIYVIAAFLAVGGARAFAQAADIPLAGDGNIVSSTANMVQESGGTESFMMRAWRWLRNKPDDVADPNLKMSESNEGGLRTAKTDEDNQAKPNSTQTPSGGNGNGGNGLKPLSRLQDVISTLTGGLIKDKYVEAINGGLPPTIGRNVEVENMLVALDSRYTTDGVITYGPPMGGKTSVINQVQREIIQGRLKKFPSDTRILEVDTTKIHTPEQLERELKKVMAANNEKKLAGLDYGKGDKPKFIVLFTSLRNWQKAEAGNVATVKSPDIHEMQAIARQTLQDPDLLFIGEAQGGVDTKTGNIGDPESIKSLYPFAKERGWRLVYVRQLTPGEIQGALEHEVAQLEKANNVEIDDDVVKWSDERCRRYYPDMAQPGCSAYLLTEAINREDKILSLGERISLAQELRIEKANLESKLQELKQLPGRFARNRVEEIPGELAELQAKIDKAEARSIELHEAAQKMKALDAAKSELTKAKGELNVAEAKIHQARKPIEVQAARQEISALQTRITDLQNKVNEGNAVQAKLKRLTIEDLAIQIHRDHPEFSYVEILKDVKPRTFEENWADFQKEYAGAESYYNLIRAIDNSAARIRGPDAPRSVTLILGAPGGGKTQLAISYSNAFKGGERITINGGDYQQAFQASNFTSAGQGYQGAAEGSAIQNAIRQKPYAELHIDEPSRMHKSIVDNILLTWLDDNGGRLTDSMGRVASMKNIDVIMTDNAGTDVLTPQSSRAQIDEYLIKNGDYNEAFLRRIQNIIVMPRMAGKSIGPLIDLKLQNLIDVYAERDIGITFENQADMAGYIGSKLAGAQDGSKVVNTIDEQITAKLRDAILNGRYQDNGIPPGPPGPNGEPGTPGVPGEFHTIEIRKGDMVQAYINHEHPELGVFFRVLQ